MWSESCSELSHTQAILAKLKFHSKQKCVNKNKHFVISCSVEGMLRDFKKNQK